VTRKDKKVAHACALVSGRKILIEEFDTVVEAGWLHTRSPVAAQVAATLAAFTLRGLRPTDFLVHAGAAPIGAAPATSERAGVAD
jgi:hypothetical protein